MPDHHRIPDWLSRLNEAQREAVEAPDGPCLVLAGAGTGKTRVITSRVAWLLEAHGVLPERVLAVTFTNKAAAEMAGRVSDMLGGLPRRPLMCTFHALGLRLLRSHPEAAGLRPDFAIYDAADQRGLMKETLEALEIGENYFTHQQALDAVGRAKDAMLTPEDLRQRADGPRERRMAEVYAHYQHGLRQANAADFDDLILLALRLLQEHEDLRRHYGERFRHILVDEFQDTNPAQYLLMRLLARDHESLFAVGDEDQSIYGWRGADVGNILRFPEDYPSAKVIRLEENYRSTDVILQAASSVVANNRRRLGKTVWSSRRTAEKIEYRPCLSDLGEAAWIADKAAELRSSYAWQDMAVLYRTNAQSRLLEDAFMRRRIPYLVLGGLRFYERREVKDILAYLRQIQNPHDAASLRRVLNVPRRGIGDKIMARLEQRAAAGRLSLWDAIVQTLETSEGTPREIKALHEYISLIRDLQQDVLRAGGLAEILRCVLQRSGYLTYLERDDPRAYEDRRGNLEELVSSAAQFEEDEPEAPLQAFLDRVALVSDADQMAPERGVQLMTVHTAKGLEFSAVFIAGLNDEIFPHARATEESPDGVEEERRLFYVALTRARERLFLSSAERRRIFGQEQHFSPSPFLEEIPPDCIREAAFAEEGALEFGDATAAPSGELPPSGEDLFGSDGYEMIPDEGFRKGMRVRHAKFGIGTVVRVEESLQGAKLTIAFSYGGLRKILGKFVQPLGG